jgi:hypothetical protein
MRESSPAGRASTVRVARLWLAIASLLVLGACYPGDQLTTEEADVVLTLFDEDADFAAFSTYSMPDSVIHLAVTTVDDISRAYDAEVLAAVESNLTVLGFTREIQPEDADVLMLVAVTAREEIGFTGYPWGGYWGWYYPYPPSWGWGWYPWYGGGGTVYTYRTGTIFMQMLDPARADSTLEQVPTVWVGALNGIVDEAIEERILDGIDQAFEQSPYLGAGK